MPISDAATVDGVLALRPVVRGFLLPLVPAGSSDLDDLVQESLTRALEVRKRLAADVLEAYVLVIARNALLSEQRRRDLERRHLPRLLDLDPGDQAPELVEQAEEYDALRAALGQLPAGARELLQQRYSGGPQPVVDGAAAARLARARARLRVEHVLALRRVDLPSAKCRQVLLALSGGQRRRQQALGAQQHLLACLVCASLAVAVLERSRRAAALAPLVWTGLAVAALARALRARPQVTGTAAAIVLLAGTGVVVHDAGRSSPVRSSSRATGVAAPRLGETGEPGIIGGRGVIGQLVRLRDVRVQSVPADEGFWVGDGPADRTWVQIAVTGESPLTVRAGEVLDLRGTVRPVTSGFPAEVGLTEAEGAGQLTREGTYLSVPLSGVTRDP